MAATAAHSFSRAPAPGGPAPGPELDRYALGAVESWRGRRAPEEAGELARDGDRGDVRGLAARLEALVDSMQAVLRLAGDVQDVVGLPIVAAEQRLADPGLRE